VLSELQDGSFAFTLIAERGSFCIATVRMEVLAQ
jgi:hypothetical protein